MNIENDIETADHHDDRALALSEAERLDQKRRLGATATRCLAAALAHYWAGDEEGALRFIGHVETLTQVIRET